jgi:hypothetical protein
MSISSVKIDTKNLNMESFSLNDLNYILETLIKNATPKIAKKTKKIKKILYRIYLMIIINFHNVYFKHKYK